MAKMSHIKTSEREQHIDLQQVAYSSYHPSTHTLTFFSFFGVGSSSTPSADGLFCSLAILANSDVFSHPINNL